MFLLDTNACIDFLLGRSATLARQMADHLDQLAVSTITVAELRVGSARSSDPDGDDRRLDAFLATLKILSFDEESASVYGQVARHIGVRRSSFDRLIGAQALALSGTLITSNGKDFADFPGLKIKNWTQ